MKTFALYPLLLVALAGCASVTPVAPAQDLTLPAQWRAQAASGALGASPAQRQAWWSAWADASLQALLAQAREHNTDVRVARATLAQTRAARQLSAAQAGPQLGLSAAAKRSRSGQADAANSLSTSLDASWELDWLGAQRAAVEASAADQRAAQASLDDVMVSLQAELALAYVELRSDQQRLAIARANLESQQQTWQLASWKRQAGLVTELDEQQALSSLEQTRASMIQLDSSITLAIHTLAQLCGQSPAALDALLSPPAPLPVVAQDLTLSLPVDTLRQRPDVRRVEEALVAALARVKQADAQRYPTLSLSGSLGLAATGLGSLTDGASVLRSLLGSLSWAVFDGGAARAQLDSQQAQLDQARAQYSAVVLAALKEVEDALAQIRGEGERQTTLARAEQAARVAAELARQRYASGLSDFSTVLDTQRSLYSAQDSLALARASLISQHLRLFKALGGPWQADQPAS